MLADEVRVEGWLHPLPFPERLWEELLFFRREPLSHLMPPSQLHLQRLTFSDLDPRSESARYRADHMVRFIQ